MIEDFAKYGLLILSNLVAFAGAWFFSFTETDKATHRKRLTPWGRIALPCAAALLVAGVAVAVWQDSRAAAAAAKDAAQAEADAREAETLATARQAELTDQLARVLSLLENPGADEADVAAVVADPALAALATTDPALADALAALESRLGGRQKALDRMLARGVELPADHQDVLIAMTLGLQWFGRGAGGDDLNIEATIDAIASILRGADADIVVVSEISNVAAFERLLNRLPQYRAVYGPRETSQVTGVLYQPARLTLSKPPRVIDGDGRMFPRSPQMLQFQARGHDFALVAVHLVSMASRTDDTNNSIRRGRGLARILEVLGSDPRPTLLMGVLNAPTAFAEFDQLRAIQARFAGDDLPADATTFIHPQFGPIVLSDFAGLGRMADSYLPGSVEIISLVDWLDGAMTLDQIDNLITDHNPILAAFDLTALSADN